MIQNGARKGAKIDKTNPPTNNPKIFKSMESFPSIETIKSSLRSLQTAMMNNDYKQIIDTLKKNVEGYEA